MTRPGLLAASLAVAVSLALPPRATAQPSGGEDGIAGLLDRLQAAIVAGRSADYMALLADGASGRDAAAFANPIFRPGVTRATVRERDRAPLQGAVEGEGYRLLVEALVERGRAGTIYTWRFEVRRGQQDETLWFIASQEQVSSLDGLYQLQLDTSRPFVARNLTIAAIDFSLTLPRGRVFVAETNAGVTGMVLVGKGTVRFAPAPAAERRQVRIFTGSETLEQPFDVA
jgi:hypothetical protein